MAKKTIELSKSKLNIVFRLIMGDLHKEFPDKIENATTKDKTNFEPGLIKTGSVNEICSFVSEKCGWKKNQ